MLEPDGSPLFPCIPLAACQRYEPRKHPRTLAITHPQILPSPLGDKIGCFHHDRFRGYVSVHCCSGLLPPCLRFVMLVTDHHARLGTRLPAKLYRGRHLRRLDSMSFQGATPTPPYVRNRIRRFGGLSTPSITARKTAVVEVGVANCKVQSFRTAWPPRAARPVDIRGQPRLNAQHSEAKPSSPRRAPLKPKGNSAAGGGPIYQGR